MIGGIPHDSKGPVTVRLKPCEVIQLDGVVGDPTTWFVTDFNEPSETKAEIVDQGES